MDPQAISILDAVKLNKGLKSLGLPGFILCVFKKNWHKL